MGPSRGLPVFHQNFRQDGDIRVTAARLQVTFLNCHVTMVFYAVFILNCQVTMVFEIVFINTVGYFFKAPMKMNSSYSLGTVFYLPIDLENSKQALEIQSEGDCNINL